MTYITTKKINGKLYRVFQGKTGTMYFEEIK